MLVAVLLNTQTKKVWMLCLMSMLCIMVILPPFSSNSTNYQQQLRNDDRTFEELDLFNYIKREPYAYYKYSAPRCHMPDDYVEWKHFDPTSMSNENVIKYLQFGNSSACLLAHRLGVTHLGDSESSNVTSYTSVCLDPPIAPLPMNNCVVYNAGLKNGWAFEKSMHFYGCQLFVFDPIGKKNFNYTERIHLINIRVGLGEEEEDGSKTRTLSSLYEELKAWHGDSDIDFMRLTAEVTGWQLIPHLLSSKLIDRVKQLNLEVYMVIPKPGFRANQLHLDVVENIKALEDYGMVRFNSLTNLHNTRKLWELNEGIADKALAVHLSWYNSKFYNVVY